MLKAGWKWKLSIARVWLIGRGPFVDGARLLQLGLKRLWGATDPVRRGDVDRSGHGHTWETEEERTLITRLAGPLSPATRQKRYDQDARGILRNLNCVYLADTHVTSPIDMGYGPLRRNTVKT